jgi:hypothetical protein
MNRSKLLSSGLQAVVATACLLLGARVGAQPYVVITTPTDGTTNYSLTTVSGWVTNSADPISSVTFSLSEIGLGSDPGRYWSGSSWVAAATQLPATISAGTNWTKGAGVTLPPLNSGISYQIIATATDSASVTGMVTITVTRWTDELVWDPGTNHLGAQLTNNPHTLGGPFVFKIVTHDTTVGGWRSALNVTSGEADLYLSKGSPPTTNGYYYASTRAGSDGWVLHSSQFNPSEEWYYLVEARAGATWNLVSGEPYVLDLGTVPDPAASGTTNVTIGAEGYRFFRTTTPASLPAWELWLGGAANLIQERSAFIPLTGFNEHEQSRAMLLVPDYLAGSTAYFVGVPGAPGQSFSFTSKEQLVTPISFNSTNNGVVVSGFPYTTYRVAVPINQIAWDVTTTPVSGDPNVAVRRAKVPNEFNSDAFSEVPGAVQDSITLVPPGLTDGTFYITVYSAAGHTFNLHNGDPTVTPRAFLGATTNDAPTRAGWRYYVLTNITEQIGFLGWELDLSSQVPGTEIALRRNAVPSRWFGRTEGNPTGEISYVDYSGATGFLQRPGHQADIWYIGIYQPAINLGAFTLTTRAIPTPPITFDNGSTNVVNLAEGRWTYFRVDAPSDMQGWDARLTNVTTNGQPVLAVRRDLLPDSYSGWSFGSDWPSGLQIAPGADWTQLSYSPSGVSEAGRLLTVGRNNMLQTGTYYVGILSSSGASSFQFTSRGIGTNYAIGVTNLAFSGATGKTTNSAGLAAREAAYYQVVTPSNSPNWLVRLTPTSGEAMLAVEQDVLPNINAGLNAGNNGNNTHAYQGKTLLKVGKQHYLLLPEEGHGSLDAQTNFLAVISRGLNPDYPQGRIGSGSATYVLESLGSLVISNLGAGALPSFGGGPLTQHISLEGGQVTLLKFTVPTNVAAMEVRLLNRSNNPGIALIPGTNAPYPHVPINGDNYGADGGWFTGRREGTDIMTFANPTPGPWTVTLKAEYSAGDYPDAACDVQIVALAPAPLAFDGANTNFTDHPAMSWQYYTITVPANALGWDLRLTNVTGGTPLMTIRRDLLPDETGAPAFSYPDWPSGSQLYPSSDWTSRTLNPDDSDNTGRLAMMAMGNSLTNGTYFIGIFNSSTTNAAYTIVSRGIGTGYAIPVTNLNFSGAGSALTNVAGLPAREAAYYRFVMPSNAPSWHLRVTPDAGGELMLLLNSQVLPNSYGNPYVPFSRRMQKPGQEMFTWFPDDGDVFLRPGTNYLAVISEGVSPPDGSHIGTSSVTYRIESLGPVPLTDLGVLSLNGLAITQHVSIEDAEVRLFSFTTTNPIPSVEVRLTNSLGNPFLALRPGTNAPVPYYYPYYSSYYGVAGGYYNQWQGTPWQGNTELITLANVASNTYTFTIIGMDNGSGAFTNTEVDLTITPHPPISLGFTNDSSLVSAQTPQTWRFFTVNVPTNTAGWELRLTGSASGPAQMSVRRDVLPEPTAPGANIFDTTWPSGGQIAAGSDWTGLNENDGTAVSGHFLGFGMNNPLEPGTYYVGVLNSSTTDPIDYTLASRGIGGPGGLPITLLDFADTNASTLAPRQLAYYQVDVPTNSPSWRVRLDTSGGGESQLVIHKDHVPNIANAVSGSPSRYQGKGLAKAGNEHYVLFPDEGETNIAPGTYFLAVISEGVNPAPPLIGTGDSAFALESRGVLPVTELGSLVSGVISNHITLEGGETKAFHFQVQNSPGWLELRLTNTIGNPGFAERPGVELPQPNVPPYYFGNLYGADGGWSSGLVVGNTLLTLVRPPVTNTITVKAESFSGGYPDATTDLVIRQRTPSSLQFSNGFIANSLADNERIFYQVIITNNPIGWRLQLSATNGTPTLRVRKDLLPSDAEPGMGFGGPSVIIVPPFLTNGTWYVEVKGGGATDFSLTSNPVLTQRPAWAMPAYGAPVTTPGLTNGPSVFADTGLDTNGVPLPSSGQGTDLGIGDFHFYSFIVPDGNAGLLRAQLLAISGNPDLYVRRGGVPTLDHPEFGYYGASLVDFQLTGATTDYANWVPVDGRTETQLGAGTWYVSVRANASNVRYRLLLSVGTMTNLASGTTLTNQSIAGGDWRYYRIAVPSNAPQSLTLTWSQQQGDADLFLRDTIPPGEPLSPYPLSWTGDSKNGGPYPAFPDPGTYTLTVPTVRPNTPLFLGFHSANDSTFTVGVTFSAQNLDITNVLAFYGGTKTVTLPAHGTAKFRVPVPADATSWRHTSTNSAAIQLYLDQGTLPDVWGTGYRIWDSGSLVNSQLTQYLGGWPWVTNQHYFFVATNTAGTAQTLTLQMDGRNAATDDSDGDGLPDSWELLHFGDLTQDGQGDFDGDGVNNATELAEGTDPANAASFRPRLTVTSVGAGHVVIEPDLTSSSYTMGQPVTLTAVADSGQFFNGWSGSTNTSNNPLSLVMNAHKAITATFTGAATPLIFTNSSMNGLGHFTATITGPAAAVLVVLGATDFGTWTPLLTNAPFNGTYNFEDLTTGAHARRNYRARLGATFTGTVAPLVFSNAGINGVSHFTATITGPAGSALVVLDATNLTDWLPLTTNAPFTGTFLFEDTATSGHIVRNYRARLAP